MRLEITDFPSDPDGATGNLRKELLNVLRKADTYPNKIGVIKEQLQFANKKLTEITKAHKGNNKGDE